VRAEGREVDYSADPVLQDHAMRIRRFLAVLPVAASIAVAVAVAGCAGNPYAGRLHLLGTAAGNQAFAQRTVTITPATRWVNVTGGETVRFVSDAGSFAWNFQTGPTVSKFDLNLIAPPGMLAQRITVYVATNPLYISNS
jgi:hypothetical protein